MLYSGKLDNIKALFSGVQVVKVAGEIFMFSDFNLSIAYPVVQVEISVIFLYCHR